MTITSTVDSDGVAVVTMQHPPVNSLTVGDTWQIGEEFEALGRRDDVRCIILTAAGKGFNAGIDIKEMQSRPGYEFFLSSGAACYSTFEKIYMSLVPTIAAVNDFCMGLGVGLVGSCDMIVASNKARFGLPEVDNGALGCASHLAKLVPPMKLRQMVFTCEPVGAQQLYEWGSVYRVCEPDELMATAKEVATKICAKRPRVLRAAKEALNHIDIYHLQKHYRLEQGYTYELNLYGDGGAAREEFVAGTRIITRDADR
ncbi:MAG TPA: enoyl-CoA hydratase family protein [Acidimicrobiales bacterium]|nr:enoyl-CoA hydratase family protein [Acidimicrobiales bacterium]